MAANLNTNLQKWNREDEFKEDPPDNMVPFEEVTICKTEIKEEVYDFEMTIDKMELPCVKEEYISSDENNFEEETLKVIKNEEQLLNTNLDVGNCKPREGDTQRNKYRCELCQSDFDEEIYLKNHYKQCLLHGKDKLFKCTYKNCQCTPEQERSCECGTCGYVTKDKSNLKKHALAKHSTEPKKHKCRDCKYATRIKENLVRHMRTHITDRAFKCTYKNCKCTPEQEKSCDCHMCGYASRGKRGLKQHILSKHTPKLNRYKCSNCKFVTYRNSHLTRHIRRHTDDKPFKCTYKSCNCSPGPEESCDCVICGYAANEKSDLKKHILSKHSPELNKYKCSDCKYTTHRKLDLQRHIRSHTNERLFKCMYKNCKCTPEQQKSCQCDSTCGYATTRQYSLKVHILVKHSGKPKKHKCRDCNYASHTKSRLKEHIRTHTNDKQLK